MLHIDVFEVHEIVYPFAYVMNELLQHKYWQRYHHTTETADGKRQK